MSSCLSSADDVFCQHDKRFILLSFYMYNIDPYTRPVIPGLWALLGDAFKKLCDGDERNVWMTMMMMRVTMMTTTTD